jgi:ribosomal protein S18 acetylase RimI-like enzyme
VFALRSATLADLGEVFPRTRALQDHEGIEISDARLEAGLRTLLGNPGFGGVWLVLREGETIGYAIVTYGFDLEFGGREGWLTELWIDADQRTQGAGTAVIEALMPELVQRDVKAVHLQVRADNPAMRLYERNGFVASPRTIMTRRIG